MGLRSKVKESNFGDNHLADDGGGGAESKSGDGEDGSDSVSCSICLETVVYNDDRSWAKLQCGHQFHLDCIGSAFNAKGVMQCPNCRKIEKGQWLYGNGSRSVPEFNIEDWAHEEDIYDLGYSGVSFGAHWCPFGSLARLPAFEDGEFTPSSYHDLVGQHGFFAEPAAASAGHPCPYIAYFAPIHPSDSAAAAVPDNSSFGSHWNAGSLVAGEVPAPYGFPVDLHYHGWDYHSPVPPPFSASGAHIGSPSQSASLPVASRPPHLTSPFHRHRSGSFSPRAPDYPGSSGRNRERVQALQAYDQQSHLIDFPVLSHAHVFPSASRSTRPVSSGMGPTASSSDHTAGGGGFVRFNIWDRDHFQQPQPPLLNQIDRDSSPWPAAFAEGSEGFLRRYGGGGFS